MFHCKNYFGYQCVNGDCPNALYDEFPWITDYYENCVGCPYDYGCNDCLGPDLLNITTTECIILNFFLYEDF